MGLKVVGTLDAAVGDDGLPPTHHPDRQTPSAPPSPGQLQHLEHLEHLECSQ